MMTPSDVRPILEAMYPSRREMVPCFIGAPGIGKTHGVYSFAKSIGVNVVTFILSNTVPSEVSGIRMPDQETKKLEVFDDSRMASLKDGDILFFDEILEAPPMLWSACLTLIQDRIMASGRKLPDVFIVAASNPVASPGIIPASTRDRFQIINLRFEADGWRKWFKEKHGVRPTDLLTQFIKDDSDQYNIFTPRRAEKLYMWLKDGEHDGPTWKIKKQVVADMFDAAVCRELVNMVMYVASPQEQLRKAVRESGIKDAEEVSRNFETMTLKQIMELLQSLPEWDEIQDILSNIEFEEQEDEDIQF